MKTNSKDPGSASAEELAMYWRLPTARAAGELARKIGVRNVGGRYAWSSIWAAEGLAPPPRSRWDELKLPHCRADDVAGILGESPRSGQATRLGQARCELSRPYPAEEKTDALAKGTAARLAGRIACASLQARLVDSNDLA